MPRTDYFRMSVTDRCNERCLYCMPDGLDRLRPRREILTYEELLRIARVAVTLGFRKFRITGGEPLLRRGITEFLRELGATPGIEFLGITTNATLLAPHVGDLLAAGVQSVNISLDTVHPPTYQTVTRAPIAKCMEGIVAATSAEGLRVKLNTVLMREMNRDHLHLLARFAAGLGIPVRFIELMPISDASVLDPGNFLSATEAASLLGKHLPLESLGRDLPLGNGPAEYFRPRWTPHTWCSWGEELEAMLGWCPGGEAPPADPPPLGFIAPMTAPHFCDGCNKVRLTPDGMLRPCLGNHLEFDLLSPLRSGVSDDRLRELMSEALRRKPVSHDFLSYEPRRGMTSIGG
jgi:cyclic pyranopterin phosphate synthase